MLLIFFCVCICNQKILPWLWQETGHLRTDSGVRKGSSYPLCSSKTGSFLWKPISSPPVPALKLQVCGSLWSYQRPWSMPFKEMTAWDCTQWLVGTWLHLQGGPVGCSGVTRQSELAFVAGLLLLSFLGLYKDLRWQRWNNTIPHSRISICAGDPPCVFSRVTQERLASVTGAWPLKSH